MRMTYICCGQARQVDRKGDEESRGHGNVRTWSAWVVQEEGCERPRLDLHGTGSHQRLRSRSVVGHQLLGLIIGVRFPSPLKSCRAKPGGASFPEG